MSDMCLDNATSIYAQVTHLYTSLVSETSLYLDTGHSFIYVLNVRDVTLSHVHR
jgi:hypothetical protein